MERTGVIIVAGGGGSRMGGARPKQFMFLGGEPILAHTVNNFAAALPGAPIIVVLPASYTDFWRNLAARFNIAAHTVVAGGEERFHSVRNGLAALPEEITLIAVQDGVRPLGSRDLILRTVATAAEHDTAVPVVEPVDSFREVEAHTAGTADSEAGSASHVIDRQRLRIVQTPQVFRAELLRMAYEAEYRPEFTDDASVAEQAGTRIWLCEGERTNLKITTSEDLVIAEALLAAQKEDADGEHL